MHVFSGCQQSLVKVIEHELKSFEIRKVQVQFEITLQNNDKQALQHQNKLNK